MDKLTELYSKLAVAGVEKGKVVEVLTKLIHNPLVGIAVALSPNKVDDLLLQTLKTLFPQ